jgi:hypothetical protein
MVFLLHGVISTANGQGPEKFHGFVKAPQKGPKTPVFGQKSVKNPYFMHLQARSFGL